MDFTTTFKKLEKQNMPKLFEKMESQWDMGSLNTRQNKMLKKLYEHYKIKF